MESLIEAVYEIIKDYREEDKMMSHSRIETWINQFDPDDRAFVLEEMVHILKQRYISKTEAQRLIKETIEFLAHNFNYATPRAFLSDSVFIDHQPTGKSQKILLTFLAEIISKQFSIELGECNSLKPKFYIYFDDILCTGDTLVKGLTMNTNESKGWFYQIDKSGKTNFEVFTENKAKLVLAYFSIHKLNIKKALSRIYYGLGKKNVDTIYAWEAKYAIENDIDKVDSKLNFLFPNESVKDELVIACQHQIEAKIKNGGYHENDHIRYREINKPHNESFFSSAPNRDRFEKIILNKCIEIYNSSDHLTQELRPKPLGYGLYTDLSLGFGALIFTWRNVPFNTPLVFWYRSQHWTSLFERKFVTYEH